LPEQTKLNNEERESLVRDLTLGPLDYEAGVANPSTVTFADNIIMDRVEAVSNISTVALRVVGGDEKGTQCLGINPGHPVHGGYKYGDLDLQVGGVSNLR
jgi:hypothetical protein